MTSRGDKAAPKTKGRKHDLDLKKLQSDPAAFRAALKVDTSDGPRRLSDIADDWQEQDFRALDDGWRRVVGQSVEPRYLRAWLERARGSSKTGDVAVMAAWALFASRRKTTGIVCAVDRDQAGLLRSSIDTLLRLNPWLQKILEVSANKVCNPHTGSELRIESADVASSFGWLVDWVVFEEISHHTKRDLFDSAFSAIAKRKYGLLVCIGNAGYRDSWVWPLRESVRVDPAWYFHALDRPASWIGADILDEQRRLLPDRVYRRLWLNQWVDGSGDALELSQIDAALTLTGPSAPERGYVYSLGVDLGLTHDASALVLVGRNVGFVEQQITARRKPWGTMAILDDLDILPCVSGDLVEEVRHAGTERLKLCRVDLFTPRDGQKVDLLQVEYRIRELHRLYGCRVSADVWQAELLLQRLAKQGVTCEGVSFTGSTLQALATTVLSEFRGGTIDLYNQPELLADLKNLRIAARSYGFRLESPKNANDGGTPHGDTATALALAMRQVRQIPIPFHFTGRRLCYN